MTMKRVLCWVELQVNNGLHWEICYFHTGICCFSSIVMFSLTGYITVTQWCFTCTQHCHRLAVSFPLARHCSCSLEKKLFICLFAFLPKVLSPECFAWKLFSLFFFYVWSFYNNQKIHFKCCQMFVTMNVISDIILIFTDDWKWQPLLLWNYHRRRFRGRQKFAYWCWWKFNLAK